MRETWGRMCRDSGGGDGGGGGFNANTTTKDTTYDNHEQDTDAGKAVGAGAYNDTFGPGAGTNGVTETVTITDPTNSMMLANAMQQFYANVDPNFVRDVAERTVASVPDNPDPTNLNDPLSEADRYAVENYSPEDEGWNFADAFRENTPGLGALAGGVLGTLAFGPIGGMFGSGIGGKMAGMGTGEAVGTGLGGFLGGGVGGLAGLGLSGGFLGSYGGGKLGASYDRDQDMEPAGRSVSAGAGAQASRGTGASAGENPSLGGDESETTGDGDSALVQALMAPISGPTYRPRPFVSIPRLGA